MDLCTKAGITPKLQPKHLLHYSHCDLNYFSCSPPHIKRLNIHVSVHHDTIYENDQQDATV